MLTLASAAFALAIPAPATAQTQPAGAQTQSATANGNCASALNIGPFAKVTNLNVKLICELADSATVMSLVRSARDDRQTVAKTNRAVHAIDSRVSRLENDERQLRLLFATIIVLLQESKASAPEITAAPDPAAAAAAAAGRRADALKSGPEAALLYIAQAQILKNRNLSDALVAALKASKADPTSTDAFELAGDIAGRLGRHSDAVEFYRQAEDLATKFINAHRNDQAAYVRIAELRSRQGAIALDRGFTTKAMQMSDREVHILGDWLSRFPGNEELEFLRVTAELRLAEFAAISGNTAFLNDSLARIAPTIEHWKSKSDQPLPWRRAWTSMTAIRADSEFVSMDFASAMADYKASLQQSLALQALSPQDFDFPHEVAQGHLAVARTAIQIAGLDTAKSNIAATLQLCGQVEAADPANTQARLDLAVATRLEGDLLLANGKTIDAMKRYTSSEAMLAGLLKLDPLNGAAQFELVVTKEELGGALSAVPDDGAAYKKYTEAQGLFGATTAFDALDNPKWVVQEGQLALDINNLGPSISLERKTFTLRLTIQRYQVLMVQGVSGPRIQDIYRALAVALRASSRKPNRPGPRAL